jgi:SAM-dependent methyltransferase
MVVEHLRDPLDQFAKICRILKPGGIFLFHTPNILGYTTILARLVPRTLKNTFVYFFHRRKEEDVFDTFYKANSPAIIRKLARKTGFTVIKTKMTASSAEFVRILPLAIIELIWIKLLMTNHLKALRTNIIVALQKK